MNGQKFKGVIYDKLIIIDKEGITYTPVFIFILLIGNFIKNILYLYYCQFTVNCCLVNTAFSHAHRTFSLNKKNDQQKL